MAGRFPYKEFVIPEVETREQYIQWANIFYQSQNFQKLLKLMHSVIVLHTPPVQLNAEEINLLNSAYDSVCARLLATLGKVRSLAQSETEMGKYDEYSYLLGYKWRIEAEIYEVCEDILSLLGTRLIPFAATVAVKIQYLTMQAVYSSIVKDVSLTSARDGYESAQITASKNLAPTDPLRLETALNYSVYLHDSCHSPAEACAVAQKASQDSHDHVTAMEQPQISDVSTQLLTTLEDNIAKWQVEPANLVV